MAALAVVSGCDFPTQLPLVENRWVVPAEETRFSVAELLPGDVSISPDSVTFDVDIDPESFSTTLGDLCIACVPAHGLTVPKPPFTGTVDSEVDLPAEVFAISVLSGQAVLEVQNQLGFDPIQPSATSTGSMTLRVTDDADGDILSELVVDGATTSFPSGTTIVRNMTLAATTVNGSLRATVELDSPLGDPVTVDTAAVFSVAATLSNVRVISVSIDVSSEPVTFEPVDLDVADIDPELSERVVEGAFILDVDNPFGVGASFDMSIVGTGFTPIDRSATISSAAMSELVIDFTGAEIQSFLGRSNVQLTATAVVDPGAGIVTVTPDQELVLDAALDLTLRLGGD